MAAPTLTVSNPLRVLPSAALVVFFGLFVFQNRVVSWFCLSLLLALMSSWVWKSSLPEIHRTLGFGRCRWFWIAFGAVAGLGLAMLLRWHQGTTLHPSSLSQFAATAVLIGVTEELVFRGYVLGRLQNALPGLPAAATSSLLHAGYKVAIFLPFAAVDPFALGGLTFAVGLFLGISRTASGSIWPCVVFHALFDLWVYGDGPTPWWIW